MYSNHGNTMSVQQVLNDNGMQILTCAEKLIPSNSQTTLQRQKLEIDETSELKQK